MSKTQLEQIVHLPIDQIVAEEQVRTEFDEESLAGLGASIQAVGQLAPARVRREGESFILVDGERRYRAMKLLGEKTIAAIVENAELTTGDIVQRQLIANVQRNDLGGMEKARAIHRLMDATNWNASEAASHLGISNATVSRLLKLLELPDEVQKQVAAGEISASAAYELTRIEDEEARQQLADAVASGRMTRDAIAGRHRRQKTPQKASATSPKRVTAMLGHGRSVTVTGSDLSLECFIDVISEVLDKARKVRASGIQLSSFIAMLRDQAQSAVAE
tara:strand:- start:106411 stop:107241 length:831 start_codon:yes stop_codon:yes gene_type:complete